MLDVGAELLQLSKQATAGGAGERGGAACTAQAAGDGSSGSAAGGGDSKAGTAAAATAVDPGSFLAVVGRSTGKWVQDGCSRVLLDDQWATNQSTTFLTAGKPGPALHTPPLLMGSRGCAALTGGAFVTLLGSYCQLLVQHAVGRSHQRCGDKAAVKPPWPTQGARLRQASRTRRLALPTRCRVRNHRQQPSLHHLLPGHQPRCRAMAGQPRVGAGGQQGLAPLIHFLRACLIATVHTWWLSPAQLPCCAASNKDGFRLSLFPATLQCAHRTPLVSP